MIEQEPDYSYPYYMLGLLYNEVGKKTQLLEYLSKSIQKKPKIPKAYYNYAILLQEVGKFKASISIIEHALKISLDYEQLIYMKLTRIIHGFS